jgi:hypothetical protein
LISQIAFNQSLIAVLKRGLARSKKKYSQQDLTKSGNKSRQLLDDEIKTLFFAITLIYLSGFLRGMMQIDARVITVRWKKLTSQ